MVSGGVVRVRWVLLLERALLLAHAQGVLGRVEHGLALLGGVVVGAGDSVRGLLAEALLAGCEVC